MHTYDQTRHTWRYDVGGFAWDNGEIGTDLWLWMSFLRTGRSDLWRMSYAMTRHLSEVDFHHMYVTALFLYLRIPDLKFPVDHSRG